MTDRADIGAGNSSLRGALEARSPWVTGLRCSSFAKTNRPVLRNIARKVVDGSQCTRGRGRNSTGKPRFGVVRTMSCGVTRRALSRIGTAVTSKVMCQGEKGGGSLHFVFVGEAKRMRSMEVRSWKTPMGRVLWRTSRKRRSMALVVRTALGLARVL